MYKMIVEWDQSTGAISRVSIHDVIDSAITPVVVNLDSEAFDALDPGTYLVSELPYIYEDRLVIGLSVDFLDHWYPTHTLLLDVDRAVYADYVANPGKYVVVGGALAVSPTWQEPTVVIPGKDNNGNGNGNGKNA